MIDEYFIVGLIIILLILFVIAMLLISFFSKKRDLLTFYKLHMKYIKPFRSDRYDNLDEDTKQAYYVLAKLMIGLVSRKSLLKNENLNKKMLDVISVLSYIEENLYINNKVNNE